MNTHVATRHAATTAGTTIPMRKPVRFSAPLALRPEAAEATAVAAPSAPDASDCAARLCFVPIWPW